jgi:glucokinase
VALRPWAERFAADRVVVGGSIARSWDVIEAPLRAGLTLDADADTDTDGATHALTHALTHTPTGVVRAALGSRAPLVGAAMAWASGTRPLSR